MDITFFTKALPFLYSVFENQRACAVRKRVAPPDINQNTIPV